MFAIVRTGGKQYRVAAGDKIVVEKLAGNAGDAIRLDDILLAGEGSELKPTDGLVVSAEIIAQAKADKVIVFKKKRRHNYRRKRGHRQQHTILRITAIGDQKAEKPKKAAAEPAPAATEAAAKPAKAPKPAAEPKQQAEAPSAKPAKPPKVAKPAKAEAAPEPEAPLKAGPTKKPATKKPASDKNA
jgi:large subunit ribosomal protein L21